jgi:hypothetical protein
MTTDAIFLGSLLSCIAWLMSAVLLIRIMGILLLDNLRQSKAMLYFALLPSSIMFTSVTLKESYQLLFVNLAIYAALKIFLDKADKYWILLLSAIIGLGVLHGALYMFGLFIIAAALISYILRGNKRLSPVRPALVVLSVALVLFFGYILFKSVYTYRLDGGPAYAIESYQRSGLLYQNVARAFYKTSVEIKGIFNLLLFIPVSLFQYLFEPMPWRISAVVDLEAVFENILRAGLIWMAVSGFSRLPKRVRMPVAFVFLSYLVLETIWSVGTINWGTSIRHHIPAMGLLAVAAFASPGRRIMSCQDGPVTGAAGAPERGAQALKRILDDKGKITVILAIAVVILLVSGSRTNCFLDEEKIKNAYLVKQVESSIKDFRQERIKSIELARQLDALEKGLEQEKAKSDGLARQLDASIKALNSMESRVKGMEADAVAAKSGNGPKGPGNISESKKQSRY